MARIRSIKPEFFKSEPVAALPLRARLTWIGLWTDCDDYGITKDIAKLIKAAVWPLDSVTLAQVEDDLETLRKSGRIIRFKVDGKRYIAVTGWEEHQKMNRRGQRKYPSHVDADSIWNGSSFLPPNAVDTADAVQQQCVDTVEAPQEQGTGNREQVSVNEQDAGASSLPDFDDFWKTYPRRVGKGAARKAWMTAVNIAEPRVIIGGAWEFANLTTSTDPTFIPHPATWLHAERWDDEDGKPVETKHTTPADLELPPDGLSPEEYRAWDAARRSA